MKKIKVGDIVSRSSYGNDILFYVDKIIKSDRSSKCVTLKGVTVRVEADAPIDDLEIVNDKRINQAIDDFDRNLDITTETRNKRIEKYLGKILHLDGECKKIYLINFQKIV